MTKINQITTQFDTPYSPGAIYSVLNRLASLGMITNNHSEYSISPAGRAELQKAITSSPLPSSWLHCSYRIIAACSLSDQNARRDGIQRITVEMIKFDHNQPIGPIFERSEKFVEMALKICHSNVVAALKKSVVDIGAI